MDERFIKILGNLYFKKSFITPSIKDVKYSKGEIPIGLLKYQVGESNERLHTGDVFSLEFSDAVRWLFLGKPGSGKTWLLRCIADRLNQVKDKDGKPFYHIIVPSDIKNEFYTSRFPLQKSFHKHLMMDEKPQGMKIITFRPTFFKTVEPNLPRIDNAVKKYVPKLKHLNYWYSVDFSKMSQKDFLTLLNSHKLPEKQQTMVELLYNRIKKIKVFKQDDLYEAIDSLPDSFPQNAKQGLKDKLIPLLESHFSEPEHFKDLVKLLQQGNQISFNLRFYDRFKSTFAYPEVLLNAVLTEISLARKTNKLNPIFILLDESPRFIPKDRNPSCKLTILESSQIDRREGISYIFVAQSLDNIDDQIVSDSNLFFIPQNMDAQLLGRLISLFGLTGTPQAGRLLANRILKRSKEYDWFILDKNKKIISIIKPFAPLSHQLETEMT